jgi:hypothetical protein
VKFRRFPRCRTPADKVRSESLRRQGTRPVGPWGCKPVTSVIMLTINDLQGKKAVTNPSHTLTTPVTKAREGVVGANGSALGVASVQPKHVLPNSAEFSSKTNGDSTVVHAMGQM